MLGDLATEGLTLVDPKAPRREFDNRDVFCPSCPARIVQRLGVPLNS
jgi:hypothetical protein